ncbi:MULTISPECIES: hypothetical protein [unclassified Bartonella]
MKCFLGQLSMQKSQNCENLDRAGKQLLLEVKNCAQTLKI